MWRPPERIRHEAQPGRWPSAVEAARSALFQPIRVGAQKLKQRTWVPAMVPWRATAEGFVSEDVLAWYARFARGRPGAIVVEATGIRDIPSGPLLRIGHDRFLPGLRDLVETVRREGIGHYQRSHVGHGIGLDGYDAPNIAPSSTDVFEEGMVICVETPYYEMGFAGLQVEDTLVVTRDGVESFMVSGTELRVV